MRKNLFLVLIFLCTVGFFTPQLQSNEKHKPKDIKVLLEHEVSGALLEVKGPYYLFNPEDDSRISSGLLGKRFFIHARSDGLKWGELFPGIHQFHIVPRSPETSILVNGIQYTGNITVYNVKGKINIINELDVENFIKSTLTTQFPYPLEGEVMSSIAILARTDAFYRINQGKRSFWHVKASQANYQGCALCTKGSEIDRSIDSTKNLILVYPSNGRNVPFSAKWNQHCAGKTAAHNTIFRNDGNGPNQSIKAPLAELDKEETKWSFSVSSLEMEQILGKVSKIEPFVDSASNKSYALRIFTPTEKKDFDFLTFQKLFGEDRLKSNAFTVQASDTTFTFEGYGMGHGVGLCLYSASAMAQNGENAVHILAKFFPQTFLINLSALSQTNDMLVDNLNERNLFLK